MSRRGRWLLVLAGLAAVQVGLWGVCDRIDRGRRPPAFSVSVEPRSEPAPDLMVERLDGSRLRIAARSDRFRLVHFWATWCPPCRRELPMLVEMARRNRARLEVWAVSADSEWDSLRRFFDGDVPAPVVRDAGGASHDAFNVTGLPDSYLIGPDGRIRARFSGPQAWTSREMDETLERLTRAS